jgi:hypothetical protein
MEILCPVPTATTIYEHERITEVTADGTEVWRRMVSPLPVQTRARLRALQARIAEVGNVPVSVHNGWNFGGREKSM